MTAEALPRRLAAEGLGSLLLAAAVIGSGMMGGRLAGGNLGVALLANAAATVAALATLIGLLGPVSGAHFNPAVSPIEAMRGRPPVAHAAMHYGQWRRQRRSCPDEMNGLSAVAQVIERSPLIRAALLARDSRRGRKAPSTVGWF